MKIYLGFLSIITALGFSGEARSSGFTIPHHTGWIGPHINLVFGGKSLEFNLGLEASYWTDCIGMFGRDACGLDDSSTHYWLVDIAKVGLDLGIDYNFTRKKWSKYGEIQVGGIFAGSSAGVVFDAEHGTGFQGSLWANWIGGGLIRLRRFRDRDSYSLGAYLKAPYFGGH